MREGSVAVRCEDLHVWDAALPQPWTGAMEATLFSDWVYDQLTPFAAALKMGNPARMRAIATSKKRRTGSHSRMLPHSIAADSRARSPWFRADPVKAGLL